MRPRIFLSSTEINAKSVMNTPRTPTILIRLETIPCTQSGADETNESNQPFNEIKAWSTELPLIRREGKRWPITKARPNQRRKVVTALLLSIWDQRLGLSASGCPRLYTL